MKDAQIKFLKNVDRIADKPFEKKRRALGMGCGLMNTSYFSKVALLPYTYRLM
jgi:hypothetical protein